MQVFITILHVLLCVFLILIILLQPGKEGAAAFGGGGANQSYGPRGQAHLLGRATTIVAALFMVTSITLAWWSSESVRAGSDIEDDILRLEAETEKDADIDWGALGRPELPEDAAPADDAPIEGAPAEDVEVPSDGAPVPAGSDEPTPVETPAPDAE